MIIRDGDRGRADYGWLQARYYFSFAGYHNPNRVRFGALRVLNDDTVAGGMGFDPHPHDNMEIITIIQSGALEHKDNMGIHAVIAANDVQIMSAGTGIVHAEYNHHPDQPVRLFQIWIYPEQRNIAPRYDQKSFVADTRRNQWQTVVAPDDPKAIWINQQAWLSLASLESEQQLDYHFHRPTHGLYLVVVEGTIEVAGHTLNYRDAIGLSANTEGVSIQASANAELLAIEVPMI